VGVEVKHIGFDVNQLLFFMMKATSPK